jgi:diaminohydroxyphosphoribosylaminopyrimidine deaminase/5-amino-6-(5-phosphoribosylamino)uracil reductase
MAALQTAGITVHTGLLEAEALADHAGFISRVTRSRPFVTLKLASSFDGRIATATGQSQWITGPDARRMVHAMRARHDGVMVGGGTARKDDPSLTVRDIGVTRHPVRIVVSRRLDLPLMGHLARTAAEVPVLICHGDDADRNLAQTWRDLGATLLPCAARAGQLDPKDILRQLANHGLTRIFCEGGSALAASLIDADQVDEIAGFTAGLMIGAEGLPGIGALGLEQLSLARRYRLVATRAIGPDTLHLWRR